MGHWGSFIVLRAPHQHGQSVCWGGGRAFWVDFREGNGCWRRLDAAFCPHGPALRWSKVRYYDGVFLCYLICHFNYVLKITSRKVNDKNYRLSDPKYEKVPVKPCLPHLLLMAMCFLWSNGMLHLRWSTFRINLSNGCAFRGTLVWGTLFPLLESIQSCSLAAPTVASPDAASIMVHHSRNTAAKQWDETRALALSGVARVLCVQHTTTVRMPDLHKVWDFLFGFVERNATDASSEVAFAASATLQVP